MRFFVIILFTIFVFDKSFAQDLPNQKWAKLIGGNGHEEIIKIKILSDGTIAGIGFSNSKEIKKEEQLLVLFDQNGNKKSERLYGSQLEDKALGITATFDGHVIYTGYVHTPRMIGKSMEHIRRPNIRKLNSSGKLIWSKIESSLAGEYSEVIEWSPSYYFCIGNSNAQYPILAMYKQDSLLWKNEWKNQRVTLQAVTKINDQQILVAGVSNPDQLLWYALIDAKGNIVWHKKGTKGYGMAKSIIKYNEKELILGGLYFDTKKHKDAYVLKIHVSDGSIISKNTFGEKYDDEFESLFIDSRSALYLVGKTKSHIRGGSTRSKAWISEIDLNTLTKKGTDILFGGNQNNTATSISENVDGDFIVSGMTASGSANGMDGWLLKSIKNKENNRVENISIRSITLIEENNNNSIDHKEAVAFKLDVLPNDSSWGTLQLRSIIGNELNNSLIVSNDKNKSLYIPYILSDLHSGQLPLRIEVLNNQKIISSIDTIVLFSNKSSHDIEISFDAPALRSTLSQGLPLIDIPFRLQNKSSQAASVVLELANIKPGDYILANNTVSLANKETRTNLLSIGMIDDFIQDSIQLDLLVKLDSTVFSKNIILNYKKLLTPYFEARKLQTTELLVDKLKSGALSSLNAGDYKQFPLDSFFLKPPQKQVPIETASDIAPFSADKISTLWIQPDPVVNKNYIVSKRNKYALSLKLIDKNQNPAALISMFLVERPDKTTLDTIIIPMDQAYHHGNTHIYNIESNLNLLPGENKVRLMLQTEDELIHTSSSMIISYTLPKNNLFVYAYGVESPELAHVAKDAKDFSSALNSQENQLFSSVQMKLYNTKALTTTQSIRKSITDIVNDYRYIKRIQKDDIILIYFSSHGLMINNEFHLLPSDYEALYEEETTIHLVNDIQNKLKDLPCKKLLIIDACHSGSAADIDKKKINRENAGIKSIDPFEKELSHALIKLSESHNDFYYLLSSSAEEVSYTDAAWGNSAFTKGILEAFSNKSYRTLKGEMQADQDKNKILDMQELYYFLRERVPVIVQSKKNLKTSQTPYSPHAESLKNIPIYVVEK